MKIAVASDEKTHLTDFVIEDLKKRGHEIILYAPLMDDDLPWTLVSEQLGGDSGSGRGEI